MELFTEEVQRKLIWQQVLEKLRKRIILGEMKKGEHLKEVVLSKELGVSRGPVREAIVQLEKEGLVHTFKNGRTKVNGFSNEDVDNLYFARSVVETAAIEQIHMPVDERYLAEMEGLLSAMEAEDLSNRNVNFLDLQFHYSLIRLSENKTLIQMWLSTNGVIKAIMEITNEHSREQRATNLTQHGEILKALQSGDRQQVKQTLEAHLHYARKVLKNFFETIHIS
ncbi:GntR family transcriptional regulator [Alkalihalobacillus oceani]|uniref:GntR family transcriptional regulator n=1 Tax=Halalkalibacter oceani TaxID=1653776 RepID=UPI00203DC47E|nr:GntR family transcriptional regulator [Halalkalibacter oceani]MCM3762956.1 GntR family transcriptional regulator [Halalkalibacter oceani]